MRQVLLHSTPHGLIHSSLLTPWGQDLWGKGIGARAVGMDQQQWRPLPKRWAPVSAPLQNLCICLGVLEDSDGPVSAFCPRRLVPAQCLEADQGLKGRKRREAGKGKQWWGRA